MPGGRVEGGAWDFVTTRFIDVLERLELEFPEQRTLLEHESPFQLLVAVILSAQTTDEQVNRVLPDLFERYPGPDELAEADLSDVEGIIRSTGYFRSKAKNIVAAARAIRDRFDGIVPGTMEELVTIPGAGRKSAGVVLHHIFGVPAIIVDTHFGRVSRRLGFAAARDPAVLEREIAAILDPEEWGRASMLLNYHGRRTCTARKPSCDSCRLLDICPRVDV